MRSDSEKGDTVKGLLFSVGGTALLSTTFVTAKYSLGGFDPIVLSLVNCFGAAGWAMLIAVSTADLPCVASSRAIATRMLLLGLISGIGMVLAYMGLELLDPSFASFLWRFQPVIAIGLGAILLHEHISAAELALFGVMISGGVLSTVGRWDVVGTGTIFVLLACAASAIQLLIAKTVSIDAPAVVLVFYRAAVGGATIALWLLLTGTLNLRASPSYWLVALLGALLGPCAGYLLIFQSYRYWNLSQSSIVHTAQPLLTLPLALAFLGQVPNPRELLGGALLLVGAFGLGWVHLPRRVAH